jgi:hypothetical protein
MLNPLLVAGRRHKRATNAFTDGVRSLQAHSIGQRCIE